MPPKLDEELLENCEEFTKDFEMLSKEVIKVFDEQCHLIIQSLQNDMQENLILICLQTGLLMSYHKTLTQSLDYFTPEKIRGQIDALISDLETFKKEHLTVN